MNDGLIEMKDKQLVQLNKKLQKLLVSINAINSYDHIFYYIEYQCIIHVNTC